MGVLVLAGATCAASAPAPAATTWLCRPGLADDPCRESLDATVVVRSGATSIRRTAPSRRAAVDCFYVYPTVSTQPTVNANLQVDPPVRNAAVRQASRFSRVCRVYAPLYRQVTIGGLFRISREAVDLAYGDVRAAWREYLRRHNRGRGVVLIGHSQGTGMLRRLARQEIDGRRAVRRRLVSAVLTGGNVKVARGRATGGDFRHIPACRGPRQVGCVVAYSSFDQPPPQGTFFGRVGSAFDALFGGPTRPGLRVLCVNPAAPQGGGGALRPYFRSDAAGLAPGAPAITTPWVTFPGRYTARCRTSGDTTWLHVQAAPDDPRPRVTTVLGPAWGLHLADVGLALGNFVDLVGRQAAAYVRRAR